MRELWKVTSVMCVIFYHGSTRNFGRETSKLNKDAKCLQTHSSPKACQTLLLLLLLLPLLLFILIIRLKSSCFCTSKLFSFSFQWSPPLFRSDGHSGSANAPGRSPLLPLHARPLPDRHKRQWLHQAGRDSLPQEKPTNRLLSLTKISVTETKFSSRGRRQLLRCSHTKTIPAQRQWGGSHHWLFLFFDSDTSIHSVNTKRKSSRFPEWLQPPHPLLARLLSGLLLVAWLRGCFQLHLQGVKYIWGSLKSVPSLPYHN